MEVMYILPTGTVLMVREFKGGFNVPDLKKVIKGLEICVDVDDGETCPKHCPYYQEVCHGYGQLMRDALALLKGLEETMIELIEQAKAEDYWAKK